MSKSNHTEAQMIGALKQLEAGCKAEDVAREVGVSKHTIYAFQESQSAKKLNHSAIKKCMRLSLTDFVVAL
jgi:putative transposase